MEHGENMFDVSAFQVDSIDKNYYCSVSKDVTEAKKEYKYIEEMPTICLSKPTLKVYRVLAVSNEILNETLSSGEDFLGKYSREIYVVVPLDYKKNGCLVYGAKWENIFEIPDKHLHINKRYANNGYHELCIGVPQSFSKEKNAFLSSIRTAEHILRAYMLFLSNESKNINLLAYSHGEEGVKEYEKNQRKEK